MPDLLINNPYEAVDWGGHEAYKFDLHSGHLEKYVDQESDVGAGDLVDLNINAGFDIVSVCSTDRFPILWPWDEFDEIDPDEFDSTKSEFETRDPESLDVVAVPSIEGVAGEHVIGGFTTIHQDDHDPETRLDSFDGILNENEFHVTNDVVAWLAHTSRYIDDAQDDWERYRKDYLQFDVTGFEVAAKGSITRMERLWDYLNERFLGSIWGFAANDVSAGDYHVGDRLGERFNDLYLDPDDYDPSDQQASREAIAEAIANGQFVQVDRGKWDDDAEDPPDYPTINEITVDGSIITIDADGYDSINWISGTDGGVTDVVDSGPTIDVTEDHVPYVRAEIDGSTVYTQPFVVSEGQWTSESDAKWSADSSAQWDIEQS